jgi:integrase
VWVTYPERIFYVTVKIKDARDTPTLTEERVPTREELRRILRSGDKKTRATCVLVAHSGLRIEVLSDYSKEDGLKLRDLPEMVLHGRKVEFKQIPTMVVVRRPLSKAGHQYFTFLGAEGCEYLREWLEQRIEQGEKLTADSPIVTSKFKTMRTLISTTNVRDAIRGAIRRAGFQWRPYVLRSYFDTQLMLAESKGLLIRDYRQFWMGHKGDIEARYTTNKGRLPNEVIEDMRGAYRRSHEFLATTHEGPSEDKIKEEFKKQLLLVAGFRPEEIAKMDLLNIQDDEFQTMIRQKLLGAMENNGARQKIVPIDEIEKHIAQGWEFVAALPNGKAIIKLPV